MSDFTNFHSAAERNHLEALRADVKMLVNELRAQPGASFRELLAFAKLDPSCDLRFTDWSGVSFDGEDLRGFDLTGAHLRGCTFKGALIRSACFDHAEVETGSLEAAADYSSRWHSAREAQLAGHKPAPQRMAYEQLARLIEPDLPHLRRYARACTGNQARGEALLAAMLDRFQQNPKFDLAVDSRLELHRCFEETAKGELGDGVARRCLLLTTVENFTLEETAYIVGKTGPAVNAAIDAELARIELLPKAKVLIIQDEAVIAMDLSDLTTAMGHTVVGVAGNYDDVLAIASKNKLDLILSCTGLTDGRSALEAVDAVLANQSPMVVFVTAFPPNLTRGGRLEPDFVITMPYSPDMVRTTISQVLYFETHQA